MPSVLTVPSEQRNHPLELLSVSKTNLTGHIIYANDRFCQISGYCEGELLGKPHSICRHPDMPRGVFSLMWERIQAGHEIFAVVQNLGKGGNSYWALAHVTPTYDLQKQIVGYHSSRRVVSEGLRSKISQLYREMLACENKETNPIRAARLSRDYLDDILRKAEASYDAHIFSLLKEG